MARKLFAGAIRKGDQEKADSVSGWQYCTKERISTFELAFGLSN
jgi:hypothetical protein